MAFSHMSIQITVINIQMILIACAAILTLALTQVKPTNHLRFLPGLLVCLVLCNEFLESIKSYITVFRVFSSNGLRSIKLCFIQTCRFVCNDSKPVGQSSSPCDDERKSMQQTISCQNTRQKIFPQHMTWHTIIVSSSCHIQIMSSSLAFINSSKKWTNVQSWMSEK